MLKEPNKELIFFFLFYNLVSLEIFPGVLEYLITFQSLVV